MCVHVHVYMYEYVYECVCALTSQGVYDLVWQIGVVQMQMTFHIHHVPLSAPSHLCMCRSIPTSIPLLSASITAIGLQQLLHIHQVLYGMHHLLGVGVQQALYMLIGVVNVIQQSLLPLSLHYIVPQRLPADLVLQHGKYIGAPGLQ